MRTALLVLVLAVSAAPAAAGARSAPARRLHAAEAVAARVFPPPCAPHVFASSAVQPGQDALADPGACTVMLGSWWRRWSTGKLCTVMVHEYGHLAGLPHSADPDSVMYPDYHGVFPGCRKPRR